MRTHCSKSIYLLSAVFSLAAFLCPELRGQSMNVEAQVASISGPVLVSGNSHSLRQLARGETLAPGDEIDTRGGGKLTIMLSDGSLVVVKPGSRVILKDYRAAGSWRELFEIIVGRVHVKINHYSGRPNPYRINTPTASIAVRGTEFAVVVATPGDTEVVVYEGQVEVASLSDPSKRVLVEPGRGVIVRPNQDMRMLSPAQAREIAERATGEFDRKGEQARNRVADRDDDSPRNSAGMYDRYITGLAETGQTPYLMRYFAFADSHLDSLENPAYATEFKSTEGRVFVLPSFSGTGSLEANSSDFSLGPNRPIDFSISPQGSLFTPLPRSGIVVGGGLAASHSGLQSFSLDDATGLAGLPFAAGATGQRIASASTTTDFLTGSFVAARRFGASGHSSFGVGIDQVSGRGSLLSLTTQSDSFGVAASARIQSRSSVGQTHVKLGFSQEFGNHKLGIFYRYGSVSASDGDQQRSISGIAQTPESSSTTGFSSEVGLRLRGPLTRRLFYGLQASWMGFRLDDQLRRSVSVDASQRDDIHRSAFGAGLGYALRPRIVFSFDAVGGFVQFKNLRIEQASGNPLESGRLHSQFVSVHTGAQADLWRKSFVSGSFLAIRPSSNSLTAFYPDRFGRLLTKDGLPSTDGPASDREMSYYSEFGFGWRFNPRFLAQYVLSTDYGFSAPSHTLLLRYTFHGRE